MYITLLLIYTYITLYNLKIFYILTFTYVNAYMYIYIPSVGQLINIINVHLPVHFCWFNLFN